MHRSCCLVLLSLCTCYCISQPAKTSSNPAKASVKPKMLKTLNDSASYAIGMSIAGYCKQNGIEHPNTSLIAQSFTDTREDKTPMISEAVATDMVNKILMQHAADKSSHDSLISAAGN